MKNIWIIFWVLVLTLIFFIDYINKIYLRNKALKLKGELKNNNLYINLSIDEKKILKAMADLENKSIENYILDKL